MAMARMNGRVPIFHKPSEQVSKLKFSGPKETIVGKHGLTRSYVHVLKGESAKPLAEQSISFQVKAVGNGGLFRSVVAILHRVISMKTLDIFSCESDRVTQFRALGGRSVHITFQSQEARDSLIISDGLRQPRDTQVDIGLKPQTRDGVEGDDDVKLFADPTTNRKKGVGESDAGIAGLLGAEKRHGKGQELCMRVQAFNASSVWYTSNIRGFRIPVEDSLGVDESIEAELDNVGPKVAPFLALKEAQLVVAKAYDKGGPLIHFNPVGQDKGEAVDSQTGGPSDCVADSLSPLPKKGHALLVHRMMIHVNV
ncbi:hypothetical protein RHMOL_Rhmol02G0176100 [Rhododendron molle]|uniref:Uncharacterized protein n=1 Tax=Rhododendron molle TaxID=49168 RepID=A0ACC0PSX7_RHOML|nr:hypothetical protein RHMOL_Rhmol02G0176100 [Rhododendron molle]